LTFGALKAAKAPLPNSGDQLTEAMTRGSKFGTQVGVRCRGDLASHHQHRCRL